jgi:hypothetical protein
MSPAQPDPSPEHAAQPRTRKRPRSHRWPKAATSETPLARLHTRYASTAIATGTGYLAVLITTVVRPSALNDAVTIRLLLALGSMAALSALGAILTWAVERMPQQDFDQQAEIVEWAIRLGEDLSDAYRAAPSGSSAWR